MHRPAPFFRPLATTCLLGGLLVATSCHAAGVPTVSSGSIVRVADFPSRHIPSRTIDVWLPSGYDASIPHAVLYMHDGQMLFDPTDTWVGDEWGVDETLGALLEAREVRPVIVVGIANGGPRRHAEYFPQKPFESLSPAERETLLAATRGDPAKPLFTAPVDSDRYLRFLVEELKPWVDATFATAPERAHTFVAGSSMGGLISLYAICEYPEVFGGAACLSTHWIGVFHDDDNPIPEAFLGYLRTHLPAPGRHRLYFDHGDAALDAFYPVHQNRVDALLRAAGYGPDQWVTRSFPGEDHSEGAWRRRFALPATFLLGPAATPAAPPAPDPVGGAVGP